MWTVALVLAFNAVCSSVLAWASTCPAGTCPADSVSPDAADPVPADEIPEREGGIERIESAESSESVASTGSVASTESVPESAVDEDDRPPSLRSEEEAPYAFRRPEPFVRLSPWKGYFGFGSGLALHLNAQTAFQQGAVAPAYLSVRGGGVLPGRGALRHAFQIGASTNLSREGAYPGGTLALRQWVLTPSYVLRIGLDSTPLPAWVATARVGLPIVLSPEATVGAELAVGAQYFARAGLAVFAELIYDVFVGGRVRDGSRSTHHLMTLEVGLQFELEVLP